jgi:hypothetical protein
MACKSCELIKWKIEVTRFTQSNTRYMQSVQQGGGWVDVEVPPPAGMPAPELPIPSVVAGIRLHLRQTFGFVDDPGDCGPGRCRCIRTGKYVEKLAWQTQSALPQPTPIPPLGQQNWWQCDIDFEAIIRKFVAEGQCFPNGVEGELVNPPDDE